MQGFDKVIKVEVCPTCQKQYTDPVDRTAVINLGMCLNCDKRINYTDLERKAMDLDAEGNGDSDE